MISKLFLGHAIYSGVITNLSAQTEVGGQGYQLVTLKLDGDREVQAALAHNRDEPFEIGQRVCGKTGFNMHPSEGKVSVTLHDVEPLDRNSNRFFRQFFVRPFRRIMEDIAVADHNQALIDQMMGKEPRRPSTAIIANKLGSTLFNHHGQLVQRPMTPEDKILAGEKDPYKRPPVTDATLGRWGPDDFKQTDEYWERYSAITNKHIKTVPMMRASFMAAEKGAFRYEKGATMKEDLARYEETVVQWVQGQDFE